jgi:hypothetical protein
VKRGAKKEQKITPKPPLKIKGAKKGAVQGTAIKTKMAHKVSH